MFLSGVGAPARTSGRSIEMKSSKTKKSIDASDPKKTKRLSYYEKLKKLADRCKELIPNAIQSKHRKWNQYQARTWSKPLNEESVAVWNELYLMIKEIKPNKIIRTKSGGIAYGADSVENNEFSWDFFQDRRGGRLTLIANDYVFVFKIGMKLKAENCKSINSGQAWIIWNEICKKFNIEMNKYKVSADEGWKWKEKTPSYLIDMNPKYIGEDKIADSVHHIDFHSAFPGALAETHREFRPMLEYLYKMRKEKPEYKQAMDMSIGYMQRKQNPIYARLSHDAIVRNNEKVLNLSRELSKAGREIVGYNTDGIWYRGEIYHGKGEGKNLGEWENDHINCIFRARSKGAYEYIENGKYFPVVRGNSSYEREKPRDEWQWGDIFRGSLLQFEWDESKGFILSKKEND